MSGKSSRTKGHNFERQVAIDLRDIYPDARRGLQYQDGTGCADVVNTPFHVECKVGKKPNIRAALKQAKNDCQDKNKVPIAVVKDDRKEPMVTLDWVQFLEIIKFANYGFCTLMSKPNMIEKDTREETDKLIEMYKKEEKKIVTL